MLGGVNTIADQILQISEEDPDALHIRSTDYLWDYAHKDSKLLLVAVSGVADEGYRIGEIGRTLGLSSEDEVLGYVLCGTYLSKEFSDYLYCDFEEFVDSVEGASKDDFPVFAFQTMGVKDEYARKGVLDELVKAVVSTEYAHRPYVAWLWEHNDEAHSDVSVFGEAAGEIESFYPSWSCPRCSGDCECSCVFYYVR